MTDQQLSSNNSNNNNHNNNNNNNSNNNNNNNNNHNNNNNNVREWHIQVTVAVPESQALLPALVVPKLFSLSLE